MKRTQPLEDQLGLWPEERDWLRRKVALLGGSFASTVRFLVLQSRLFERETCAALRERRRRAKA